MTNGYDLRLGDCLEVLPGLDAGSVDAVITDPPYGIGEHGGKSRTRGKKEPNHVSGGWDNSIPSRDYFLEMKRISRNQIIFGGNYFSEYLPASRGWIYWRKLMGGDFGDGELIWTSYNRVLREFTLPNKGFNTEHPTQKPEPLMLWIIENFTRPGDTICDPFMGSGSTGVAALKLGRYFIGHEINPAYFAIAKRRIEAAAAQPPLFTDTVSMNSTQAAPTREPVQGELGLG